MLIPKMCMVLRFILFQRDFLVKNQCVHWVYSLSGGIDGGHFKTHGGYSLCGQVLVMERMVIIQFGSKAKRHV